MGRSKRISIGGYAYHVMNRANGRLRIFRKNGDFAAFEQILAEGLERTAMRMCGYCIMGNHWHLLLWPREDADLSNFLHWVTLTHTQRYHAAHGSAGFGHIYQGRFKSFPVQSDRHYLTLLRYIEANPLRAEIVDALSAYPWSSFAARNGLEKPFRLTNGPVPLPANWNTLVARNISEQDKAIIANSIKRGAPMGNPAWTERTAAKMNLESTLKPRGRPKKDS